MTIREIAKDAYSIRYFLTLKEYLIKKDITSIETIAQVKKEYIKIALRQLVKTKKIIDLVNSSFKGFTMQCDYNINNIVIHPSTRGYKYQISVFNGDIASSHKDISDKKELLETLLSDYKSYTIKEVI